MGVCVRVCVCVCACVCVRLCVFLNTSLSSQHHVVKDGYRLTYPGYDNLAMRVFTNRDVISWYDGLCG